MANRLREALQSGEFVVTCEIIPGRGANESAQRREFEEAQAIWETGRTHAVSITDNPSGNPALLADAFAHDFFDHKITPLVHMTCKDRSRNQFQSQFYALQRTGIENLLVMSGDYQTTGWQGRGRPVFDLDPVQLLMMIGDMNEGLTQQTAKGEFREAPAHFFAGAVVNPFKYTEGETMTQYLKLEKKICAGARFIISQLGYDSHKMQEVLTYLRERGYRTPLIANVFLLTVGAAHMMRAGSIAGCSISDELMATLEQEAKAEDRGAAARHLRAAKMIAIARGQGYAGVHIGGFGITVDVFNHILDAAEELQEHWQDWALELTYGKPGGFFFYTPQGSEASHSAVVRTEAPAPASASALVEAPRTEAPRTESPRTEAPRTEVVRTRKLMRGYGLSRFFHRLVLTRNRGFYGLLAAVMDRRERKKGLHRSHALEHLGKTILYGCMDCGDCGLEAAIYTCPMTQCPKCQRNGPCGGSTEGWCEVYPGERYCIYFKAYHRLKRYDELDKLDSFITPPNNWDFYETSGWSNYTHERDNAARRISLPPRGQRTGLLPLEQRTEGIQK
ncbi:MAG: methylenetetrahydrofolate reductase C-terminal domain-containing protein [Coriobacteriales bacterium]|nr:methylenetetrahydrofolate reductase C-terminal domain-containing protein [Coriobacteriales bacterium]